MQFKFEMSQRACCGRTGETQTLLSSNYPLTAENAEASFVKAVDSFYNNYRARPIELVVTTAELELLQNQVNPSDFAIVAGHLTYRKILVTTKD